MHRRGEPWFLSLGIGWVQVPANSFPESLDFVFFWKTMLMADFCCWPIHSD